MRQVGTLASLIASMPKGDPRYALFLGAGASISSGIPSASALAGRWKRQVYCDVEGRLDWHPGDAGGFDRWCKQNFDDWKEEWQGRFGRQPSDYALLFNYVCPDVDGRQGYIEHLLSGAEPGPGYIYLASLTLEGYFHTFLTTNFDDLIHDALFRYGGLKPAVSAFDSQVASVRLQGPRPKIIKLHGDFLFNNIRNLGSEVAHLDQNMQEKFERTCESFGLVVIGFGGQDQSVMAPLRAMVHRRDRLTHGLHWCVRRLEDDKGNLTHLAAVPEELYRMWEAYPEKVHLYLIDSFDAVMEAFYMACQCSPPPELAHPEQKALYVRLRDGLENADQTWQLRSHFSILLRQFRAATARPLSPGALRLDEADEAHRRGLMKVKAEKFSAARASFEKARDLASSVFAEDTVPAHAVHACRRLSGVRTSLIEILLREAAGSAEETTRGGLQDAVAAGAGQALDEVRRGLTIDREMGSPPELCGHRLNLHFNGLLVCGYRLYVGLKMEDPLLDEALDWLDRMSADLVHGDEYVEMIRKEFGGQALLAALEDWAKIRREGEAPPSDDE